MSTKSKTMRRFRIAGIVIFAMLLTWRLSIWPFDSVTDSFSAPADPDDPAAAPLDEQQLRQSAVLAGRYLTRAVQSDGRFVYLYDPQRNETLEGYNMLRHAGAVYAMMSLYGETHDPQLLAAAEHALQYLLDRVYDLPLGGRERSMAWLADGDHVKVGGAALAILAICEYTDATGDRSHAPQAVKLANWLCSLLQRDGSFRYQVMALKTGRPTDMVSEYYPGQAVYALARLHRVEADPMWVTAAATITDHVIHVRDAEATELTQVQDHWLLYGLNELHRINPKQDYLDHTQRICRAIISSQLMDVTDSTWVGGFDRPPRSTPTACRTEGLSAAYRLLRDHRHRDLPPAIRACLNRAVRFQLRTQYNSKRAAACPDPDRTLGGFAADLDNGVIQVDCVQHNLSGILELYRLMKKN